ncbi:MAG TPA: hypothetical protein VH458_10315 [Vicinamibacterales bacterium]|jgi:hypothetical protein
MWSHRRSPVVLFVVGLILASAAHARAQGQTDDYRWFAEVAIGVAPSINGNVNSGAIGTLQGQTAAILPNTYGDVYGTGLDLRFGGGYVLDKDSEVRGIFTYQSADADLVRLGDIGPSSLYSQYSDYKSFSLDFGYRRYIPVGTPGLRVFGEATLGIGFISRIDAAFAAPQSNLIFTSTDFYDRTAAFTWGLNGGVLLRVAEQVDVTAQIGLRHVGGLAEIDQFVGTGLEDINNDSARLTVPFVVGARVRFK